MDIMMDGSKLLKMSNILSNNFYIKKINYKIIMICKKCNQTKDKSCFSNAQKKNKADNRKCIDCCENNNITLSNQIILFSKLINWLKENGSYFPDIEIKHINENFRSVVNKNNIHQNKTILKVPHKCIMTSLKAKQSEVGLEIEKSKLDYTSNHIWISLFLLQEKMKPNSFWKPYIDILPKKYSDFPQFYSDEELGQLKGSFVADMIKSRNLYYEKDFNKIKNTLKEFGKKISLEDYIWSRIAVVSRVFHIKFNENENTEGLVPMADMLNHSKNPGTKWGFVLDDDSFIIKSSEFHFKNNELFDTYGQKCNSRYLVNYGFTLENNHDNNQAVVFIKPENIIDEYKCFYKEKKLEFLQKYCGSYDDSYSEYKFLITNNKETLVSKEKNFRFQFMKLIEYKETNKKITGIDCTHMLFGFLRFILSDSEEYKIIIKKILENKTNIFEKILLDIQPVSFKNELLVLKNISTYCQLSLDKFLTTMNEDITELKNTKIYTNRWNILNMLIGEKKTLHFYIDLYKFINTTWDTSESIHRVFSQCRKNKEFSIYHTLFLSKLE